MKKWQKVILIILIVLTVLGVSGYIVYKKVIEPIIDEKLDIVIDKLEVVANSDEMQDEIDDMVQIMIDDGVITEESIPTYNQLRYENQEKRKQREQEENERKRQEEEYRLKREQGADVVPLPPPTPTPTPTPINKKDLKTRMKEAMTAEEFSFAVSMYGKIDLGHAQHLYSTDKAAAKEYIYSRLTSAEISRSLEIYAKYSYLVR